MTSRGARGRASTIRMLNNQQSRISQRPGEINTKIVPPESNEESRMISDITDQLTKLSASNFKETDLSSIASSVRVFSRTSDDLKKCINIIYNYGLKSKWNAHAAALLSALLKDVAVENVKFKIELLRILQSSYSERHLKYSEIDTFILDVIFLCEIFHHLRLPDGSCYKYLAAPVLDYFGMLIDGSSEKEIELVREQIPRCYENLKNACFEGVDSLLKKIRKQIISESTSVTAKAMLLEMLELMLTDFKPLKDNAKTFYEVLTKPVIKICE